MFSEEWDSIMNQVVKFQNKQHFTWFRGQKDSEYELKTGLYRQNLKDLSSYVGTEKTYYNIFNKMGHIHHRETDWNLLYVMQHHGVKTRLLDWTESFSIALYFAYLEWEENKSCSVYMLHPLYLNAKTLGEQKFYTPEKSYEECIRNPSDPGFNSNSLALYPLRNTTRIIAQQGMFTIQGVGSQSLDNEFDGNLFNEDILKKIDIEPHLRSDVEKYLRLVGVNPFTLFPDLDGLAKYINNLGYFRI